MTDNITLPRATVQQALKALESGLAFPTHSDVLQNLRTALEQQQAEPVAYEAIHAAWAAGFVQGEKAALEQQAEPPTCEWSSEDDDTMPSTYRSACGELWSFIDGGWKDNRVNFCHGCGGKVVEASSDIQEPKS